MKYCNKCDQWKDESEFYRDKSTKDGLYTICKQCKKEYRRNKRKKIKKVNRGGRPSKLTERWLNAMKDVLVEKSLRLKDKDDRIIEKDIVNNVITAVMDQLETKKEKIKFLFFFKNMFIGQYKQKLKKRGIKYINSKQYQREYYHKVIKKDPAKRLRRSFSANLRNKIKKNGASTFRITQKYLGYDIKDLMDHLESLFKDGMSWENYGEWHIDHIKPAAAFNYDSFNDEQFKECWSLNNLQPLWASENHKKGAIYDKTNNN